MHAIPVAVSPFMLFLLLKGPITEAAMVPTAPIGAIMILAGVLLFLVNALRNAY